jgi:hypothetical protein
MNNLPISKAKARSINSILYFTGKPCPKGHISPRYVSTGACVTCNSDNRKKRDKKIKVCRKCGQQYTKRSCLACNPKQKRNADQKAAHREQMKQWRLTKPERYAAYKKSRRVNTLLSIAKSRAKRLGIAPYAVSNAKELEIWIKAQPKYCAICKRIGTELVIDHDHSTGRLRGMLCRYCNRLAGIIEHYGHLLTAAKEYLSSHSLSP